MEEKIDKILNKLERLEERIEEIDNDIIENQTISKQFWLNMLANLTADVIFTSAPYINLKNNVSPFHNK